MQNFIRDAQKTSPKKNRQETDDKPPAPSTVSDQLFDLFVAKQLSEDGLLQAVCGASDYKATEAVSLRAIESFRDGLLSEAGLMQILGHV